MAKKVIFVLSLIFNVVFLLFMLLGLAGGTSSFLFLNYGEPYLNGAFIVSVPAVNSDFDFGPVEITLGVGDAAYLQYAFLRNGKQSNLLIEPLYDHSVIAVDQSGFGIVVRGINPGEAVLQLFSPSGFKDVAYVTVY